VDTGGADAGADGDGAAASEAEVAAGVGVGVYVSGGGADDSSFFFLGRPLPFFVSAALPCWSSGGGSSCLCLVLEPGGRPRGFVLC
jgi:hypothetical protein